MLTRSLPIAAVACALSLATAACTAETGSGEEELGSDGAELTSTVQLGSAGRKTSYTFRTTTTRDVVLAIDCRPPGNPAALGPVFSLSAPTLPGMASASDPPRAGAFTWAGRVAAGSHSITLTSLGEVATCTVRTTNVPASATCRSRKAWRSPNMNHTHLAVGADASPDWEAFPASGNHWGAWAMWGQDYAKPVKKGFLLHNLEHGGLVFSYKCASATESAACRDAHDKLLALAESLGERRVLITPDPTQPEMFGVRGWRWAYTSACLDPASARSFAATRFNRGREDIDADPPIPYDPTTLTVPCRNLMAAPDSCN